MMTNLFSSFDPSTSFNFSFNWLIPILALPIMPLQFWILPSRSTTLLKVMKSYMLKELKAIIPNKSTILFLPLFTMIMLCNSLGLASHIFTFSSHLVTSLSLAIPLWLSLITSLSLMSRMYSWLKKTTNSLAHLVPSGTPKPLMPFMVLIETISILIRPLTLAIRLSANMIAGHLLITLLSNLLSTIPLFLLPMAFIPHLLLLSLEVAVSIIQAYVITILLTLYASEIE